MTHAINNLFIIQARLTSTRFPNKVLEKVNGKSLIARVCEAARGAMTKYDKVVVAWAHKYPHLDENDVLGRFSEISLKLSPKKIVRLTADCPLLTSDKIRRSMCGLRAAPSPYFCNRVTGTGDGFDVEIFDAVALMSDYFTDREHVIKPEFKIPRKDQSHLPKLSVDTPEDLERVRAYVKDNNLA